MRSKFLFDPQNSTEGAFQINWDDPSFLPAEIGARANPLSTLPSLLPGLPPVNLWTPIIPEEAVEAQAAQSGTGGSGSVVAVTSSSGSGFTINLLFDSAAMAAPASFRAGIQQAASMLASAITDKITVNIKIDYSGTGGGAAAGPDNGQFISYSTVKSDLIKNAAPGDTTFNALPGSISGQPSVVVWNAQLKLFGLLSANDTTTDDGSATFATDINSSLLVGVALHELTHALGRVPYGPQADIFDLFRFTSPAHQLFTNGNTAAAAYFSVDGGNTKLADFGLQSDPSDFFNSSLTPNDPFNEYYSGSTIQGLTGVDKEILDALGFNTIVASSAGTAIESFGSTSLTQVGSRFFLYSGSGSGPSLKNSGADFVSGQFGAWAPIGAELMTSGGYEVAWKVTGADQYSIWDTDSNGSLASIPVGSASGASYAIESLEQSFHQDLNGNGTIGFPTTVIEATGTVLVTLSPFTQAAIIDSGATLELSGIASGAVTFSGLTGLLKLDHSSTFTGQIINFTGNGILSSSDQIDLRDIAFGSGTTDTYVGNSSSGTLTISDAQNHTAHISLAGNYNGATFSLFSDGNGGTLVVDPPVQQDTASGSLLFSVPNSTDQHIASVSPHDGGAGYVGNFTVDAINDLNGQASVGWHFNLDIKSIAQTTSQLYDVIVAGANSNVSQTVSVTIGGPGNDSFLFHPGLGTEIVVNATSAVRIELDGFKSITNINELTTFLNEAQAGQVQALFQSENDGHDTVITLGNHDSITLLNLHLADLHASNFIIT